MNAAAKRNFATWFKPGLGSRVLNTSAHRSPPHLGLRVENPLIQKASMIRLGAPGKHHVQAPLGSEFHKIPWLFLAQAPLGSDFLKIAWQFKVPLEGWLPHYSVLESQLQKSICFLFARAQLTLPS